MTDLAMGARIRDARPAGPGRRSTGSAGSDSPAAGLGQKLFGETLGIRHLLSAASVNIGQASGAAVKHSIGRPVETTRGRLDATQEPRTREGAGGVYEETTFSRST
jgi:hypothetical protein